MPSPSSCSAISDNVSPGSTTTVSDSLDSTIGTRRTVPGVMKSGRPSRTSALRSTSSVKRAPSPSSRSAIRHRLSPRATVYSPVCGFSAVDLARQTRAALTRARPPRCPSMSATQAPRQRRSAQADSAERRPWSERPRRAGPQRRPIGLRTAGALRVRAALAPALGVPPRRLPRAPIPSRLPMRTSPRLRRPRTRDFRHLVG